MVAQRKKKKKKYVVAQLQHFEALNRTLTDETDRSQTTDHRAQTSLYLCEQVGDLAHALTQQWKRLHHHHHCTWCNVCTV